MASSRTEDDSLGNRLRSVRLVRGFSLKTLARGAKISVPYLQKLEEDAVKEPSPHILLRLAQELSVGYGDLMHLAGYFVPQQSQSGPQNVLAQALDSEPLTDDEVVAIARYLAWYRHSKKQGI